jgi:hypothetical protein
MRMFKRPQEEESYSDPGDVEMSDPRDDGSLGSHSPRFDTEETPASQSEEMGSPMSSDRSDSKHRKVTIEEVEDVDAPERSSDKGSTIGEGEEFEFIEDFPGEAGTPGRRKKTPFEKLRKAQREENQEPWSPFADEAEWELARWLMTAGMSQTKIDEYLKLPIVSAIVKTHLRVHH